MGEALWPYERVITGLRRKIASGEYTGKLPVRTDLAEEYGVSHMTVQRAIDRLKEDGLLYSKRGLGVFVRESHRPATPAADL